MTYPEPDYEKDRKEASDWARRILKNGAVILDTETTGLGDMAEIVQIGLLDTNGQELLHTLVKPMRPNDMLKAGPKGGKSASDIHHITPAMVEHAPTWPVIWPKVAEILKGKTVIVYNAAYDIPRILFCCRQDLLPEPEWKTVECAMLAHAAWTGNWNSKYGSYKWPPLEGGDHSALGDCRATLLVIKKMAGFLDLEG